jgi:CheY-like chemotaxis protein
MASILDSIANLAWPIIVAVAVWRIAPTLRDVIRERDVKARGGPSGIELSVGGQPISTQQAVDDQRRVTEAVRAELSFLAAELAALQQHTAEDRNALPPAPVQSGAAAAEASTPVVPALRRILWVDDQPSKNAYELAALRDREIDIVEATTTEEALSHLLNDRVRCDVIVTDMHRVENGQQRPIAGIELLKAMRKAQVDIPTVVYTSIRSVSLYASQVRDLGALGATATATELFELLGFNFGPALAVRLESDVRRSLTRLKFTDIHENAEGWSFLAHNDVHTVGIEVKAWIPPVSPRAVDRTIARLIARLERGDADEVWLVSATTLTNPHQAARGRGRLRLITVEELRNLEPATARE